MLGLSEVFQGLPHTPPPEPENHIPDSYPYLVHLVDEPDLDLSLVNIGPEWPPEIRNQIQRVLQDNTPLFRKELGSFNNGVFMPIPFKDREDGSDLRQAPYSLSPRDRRAMDDILDPLKEIGVVEDIPLGKPARAASPAFVVWRDGKPRVVVDLRQVNTKLFLDGYPLPRQEDIFDAMGGATVFSVLDMVKSFFQQKIATKDRWKTAFVTPHRGHEQLTISTMGLATSPAFFQHHMENIFGKYLWQFVLVYIDDVIIFSRSIQDYIKHLAKALHLLRNSGVTLSLSKCHFAQSGLAALGHHVSRLGLATTTQKTAAIKALEFPRSLSELDTGIGFFGYHHKFVDHFTEIIRPLQILKTRGFKGAPIYKKDHAKHAEHVKLSDLHQDQLLRECWQAWETLKQKLIDAPTLAFPDFTKPFILHVDGSKQRGFGAALYQADPDNIERPILFLSRWLNPAELNYWPAELETAALVWALQKLPQYLDHGKFTVYTDHKAIRDAFQDKGRIRNKGSTRLINWRLFLSKYADRIQILHRPGKDHQNTDGLSRLPAGPNPNTPARKSTNLAQVTSDTALQVLHYSHAFLIQTRSVAARVTSAPGTATSASREPDNTLQPTTTPETRGISSPRDTEDTTRAQEIEETANHESPCPSHTSTIYLHQDIIGSIIKLLPAD